MECKNCNSTRIEKGIKVGTSSDYGNIGPKFRKSVFVGVAQTYCDLCLDCGEIVRIYIKEDTDKKWVKK